MKVRVSLLIIITVCLCLYIPCFAADDDVIKGSVALSLDDEAEENIDAELDNANAVYYSAEKNYGEEIVDHYVNKSDLLGYLDSPYVSPFSSMIAGNTLSTYALPYYGNITYYGDQNSPLSRFSTGLTRFTTKSMYIFDKVGIENTLLANDISNILLNSLLSYFTGNIFGLNIWGSSDISYTSGFEAIIRPFRNMAFSYSYMTEQNMNMTTFQFKFGYNRNGNLAVINAHSFGDNTPVNTTTGVEWQFYF